MLGWYIGKCMVSLIKISSGIKEHACGYQNCNTTHILIFNGYVKVRGYLCPRVIICVHTILSHFDVGVIMLR
jgi:hypothetical protein